MANTKNLQSYPSAAVFMKNSRNIKKMEPHKAGKRKSVPEMREGEESKL